MSIALTLAMTAAMCFGCFGSVYAAPTKLQDFSECSWEEIGQIVGQAIRGDFDLADTSWSIGDTKDVTLTTGETIQLQIADFNHDTFEDGTTAPVTLVMKDCLNTEACMNDDDDADSINYHISKMKSYVETYIYDKLPDDLKSIVAPVTKKYYTDSSNVNSLSESSYNVWLLSEMEVFGEENWGVGTEEGSKYSIFTDAASRVKSVKGSNAGWWLRSVGAGLSNGFCDVVSDGTAGSDFAEITKGVVVGMCIKGTSENTNIVDVTVPESISLTADAEGNFSSTYTFANSGNVSLNIKGTVNMANGWELVESESGKVYKDVKKVSLCMNNVDIATIKHDTVSDTDIGGDFDAGESINVTVSGKAALSSEGLQNVNFASFNLTITPR